MAWIRLSDDYVDHPKFAVISDGAFRLWHQAIAYCRRYQTDGLVSLTTVRGFKAYSPKRMKELVTPWRDDANPLWVSVEAWGIRVHDYLIWNLSKEEENQQRAESKQRMALSRDSDLRNALRLRDGGRCRYCGDLVSWADRRGPKGATYDHVDPNGTSLIDNLVIACRGCNSRKGSRTPEQANMVLRPPSSEPELRSDLNRIQKSSISSLDISGLGRDGKEDLKKDMGEKPLTNESRAGRLRQELYPEWYALHRHGAKLRLVSNPLEFQDALTLVETWDDGRLEKLAKIFLTTDDPWISRTDRGFKIFAMKATWADEKLAAWEHEHGVTV